jgi:hypothetical protein
MGHRNNRGLRSVIRLTENLPKGDIERITIEEQEFMVRDTADAV